MLNYLSNAPLVTQEMTYFYVFIGGFVIFTALFRRALLIQKKGFRIILGISVILFLTGLILHFIEAGRDSNSGALLCPLINLGQFRLYRKVFIKYVKREPKDTFLNFSKGLGRDRLFNILFFVSAFWLLGLVTAGMAILAEAGW
jgi:hypothetical protein